LPADSSEKHLRYKESLFTVGSGIFFII